MSLIMGTEKTGLKLAFSGKAGSGKTECVTILQELVPVTKNEYFTVLKFAEELYQIMYMVQDHLGIERHKDGRFLQLIGSEWGRKKDINLWVNKFKERYHHLNNQLSTASAGVVMVCDDVRMVNEFFCVQNLGFTTIRIVRDQEKRKESLGDRELTHSSEMEQELIPDEAFDYVIYNNGSKDSLRKQLTALIYKETYKY